MLFRQISDSHLAQNAYLIGCQRTGDALLIDPERDVDRYLEIAASEELRITAVAETHIHADFLSGARELAEQPGVRLYLSDEGGDDWRYLWARDQRYESRLLKDGDTFAVGAVEVTALHTPGHTPEHLSFLVRDRGSGAGEPMGLVSGDFVFVGDLGRPDLLESAAGQAGTRERAARELYRSVRGFLDLPDFLQIWPGHGAGSACGKAPGAVPMSTVGYERRFNSAIADAVRGEQAFVSSILSGQPEPPLYFGRMKRLNKEGPPLLGELPVPRRLTAAELADAARSTVVLDTRLDRTAFMRGHLPGSLYAPIDKSFPTVAGSYVDPEAAVHLIIAEPLLEEAVRDLVRIGIDRVAGFAPPETLAEHAAAGGELRSTEVADFTALRERYADAVALDVRTATEYEAGHVPGAVNVSHTRLLERCGEIPEGERVAVYCRTGARAAVASALLERRGHDVVYVDDVWS